MSKSRANVLLIFQCPGICPTPSQVDILVSDDSPAFSPTMYNRVFTWVETRAISELRVRCQGLESSTRLDELGIELGTPVYKTRGLSTTPRWLLLFCVFVLLSIMSRQ